MDKVYKALKETLEDWTMMQKTSGDEGAEWAERFERHFYEFIEEVKNWYKNLDPVPKTIDELEELEEIKEMMEQLPGPLVLNFMTELEDMVDGIKHKRYD